ncbi:DUF6624 domain-containing protein [Dyadobacter sp. CY356]|uniref:DUF6624 domain-containing protein n=1 Tax=Dyadobacter sp. CY356 TaxID=2906442 RepID=UPI001F20D910|nr:DUF6624 domain-containing protein [Dyadobacter sp. CY356]MCF0055265.1 hypothetical protein [Dyadobacter sp. CY356]
MDPKSISKKIVALIKRDLQLRDELIRAGKISDGYDSEMERIHNSNARELNVIIDLIGFPTMDKVGIQASEAAWLIIQHAIGQPVFMKKCRDLLKIAVIENKATPIILAYLTDRIAVLEGAPQLYGTQFDWDDNGELSPNSYDDLTKVNLRRKSVGLNSLEDQTEVIRTRAKKENQTPPKDFDKRKHDFDEWRKKVGWTQY